jgi:hypothetical protein
MTETAVKYRNPAWLYEGQVVYIDPRLAGLRGLPSGTGMKCRVEAAHGDHGLVVSERFGFRRLMSKWDMWLLPEK